MASPIIAKELQASIRFSLNEAKRMRHEYLTLEHLLLGLLRDPRCLEVLKACGSRPERLKQKLERFLEETVERLPEGVNAEPQQTIGVERVLQRAAFHALSAEQKVMDSADVLVALFREDASQALFFLKEEGSAASTSSTSSRTASPRTTTRRAARARARARCPASAATTTRRPARRRTRSRPTAASSPPRPRRATSTR